MSVIFVQICSNLKLFDNSKSESYILFGKEGVSNIQFISGAIKNIAILEHCKAIYICWNFNAIEPQYNREICKLLEG